MLPSDALRNLERVVSSWDPNPGVQALAALSNVVLSGCYGTAPQSLDGCGRATLQVAAAERDAHRARVVTAYAGVQGAYEVLLAWLGDLQGCAATLQVSLDAAATGALRRLRATGGGCGGAGGDEASATHAVRVAERCREFTGELVAAFAAELALRATLTKGALPDSCAVAWSAQCATIATDAATTADAGRGKGAAAEGTAAAAAEGTAASAAASAAAASSTSAASAAAHATAASASAVPGATGGMPRATEGDHEAHTVLVSAWALRAYAQPARISAVLEALHALVVAGSNRGGDSGGAARSPTLIAAKRSVRAL